MKPLPTAVLDLVCGTEVAKPVVVADLWTPDLKALEDGFLLWAIAPGISYSPGPGYIFLAC